MTEAMPFLRKIILLSYDPRPLPGDIYLPAAGKSFALVLKMFRFWLWFV